MIILMILIIISYSSGCDAEFYSVLGLIIQALRGSSCINYALE